MSANMLKKHFLHWMPHAPLIDALK